MSVDLAVKCMAISIVATLLLSWLLADIEWRGKKVRLDLSQMLRKWRSDSAPPTENPVKAYADAMISDHNAIPRRTRIVAGAFGAFAGYIGFVPIFSWGTIQDVQYYVRFIAPWMIVVQSILGYGFSGFLLRWYIRRDLIRHIRSRNRR